MRAGRAFVLGAACSAALLAAGLAAAFWVFPTALRQARQPASSEARLEARAAPAGNIASWPEIKNGVPEMIAATSAPTAAPSPAAALPPVPVAPTATAVVAPSAPRAAPAPQATLALTEPPPVPDPMLGLRATESSPDAPPLRGAAPPDSREQPLAAAVAAAPNPVAEAGAGDEQAVPAVTPLPPRRPFVEPAIRRSPPARQRAVAAAPAPEPRAPAPSAAPEPAAAERSILGLPIPDIIPSGRRVKECLLELKC
jgi:hypothetical protein